MSGERPQILLVDDEPNVLEALRDTLRRRFEVTVCTSGFQAIGALHASSYAVVVSDMRMPTMDGATFLGRARAIAPDSVRILLTGYADIGAAMAAVNHAGVFRFLLKPCRREALLEALDAAVEQHRLITAERVLLQETLTGCVRVLTEILSLVSPTAFGRAMRAKRYVSELADRVAVRDRWAVEVAALLSQIGSVTLPEETLVKLYEGLELSPAEREMVDKVPATAERLLRNIPRLDAVRLILRNRAEPFGCEQGASGEAGDPVAFGSRALKIALDFDELEAHGLSTSLAIDTMRSRHGQYDPELLELFAALRGSAAKTWEVRELTLIEIEVGMTFAEDLRSPTGALLVPKGSEVTPNVLERLHNLRPGTVREPVRMLAKVRREQHAA